MLGGFAGGGMGDGLIRIGAETSALKGQVRGAVQSVKQELNAGARDIQRQGSAWSSAFNVIGAAARIGLAGIGIALGAAAGEAIGFEKAFAGVRKSVQGTPAELEALRKGFLAMSTTIPQTASNLAAIGETAGALGIKTKDIMGFTRVVALIGSTTNVSTDQAATALGQLSNILKLTSKDFNRFGSALVYLGINGASTESQILEIASRSGAAGKLIGFSANQTLAWGSAVASLGIEVEAGGSSLQNFYLKSLKLINDPAGLKVLAKTAGMTGKAFADLFGRDSSGALEAFLQGLNKLASKDQLATLTSLGLSNIRIQRTLLGLAGNTDLLTNSLKDSKKAWDENTQLQIVAARRFDTTAARLTILKNTVVAALIGLGDILNEHFINPLVKGLTDTLPKAFAFIANLWSRVLYPPISTLVARVGDLLGTIGQVFSMGGKATSGGGIIATALTGIANAAGTIVTMVNGVLGALNGLLQNPIAAWALRIAGAFIALRVAIGLGGEAVGRLNRLGGGLVRFATFGKLGGSGAAASTPLDASAAKLDGSAVALKEAAAALKGGGALNILEGGPVTAMNPRGEAAARAKAEFNAMSKAEQMAALAAAQPGGIPPGGGLGGRFAGGLRGPLGGLKGALGGLLGGIGKVFWPLMIADIATELIKAPLGDFIGSNPSWKRAGAKMKDDFWGGLTDLWTKSMVGGDASVGHAETMTIGKTTFKTLTLAKIGIDSATFDNLEAPLGTIAHAQGTETAGRQVVAELARKNGESLSDWWVRIKDLLPAATMKAAQDYIDNAQHQAGGFNAQNEAGFLNILRTAAGNEILDLTTATRQDYLSALTQTLVNRGYTPGTIAGMSTAALSKVAAVMAEDTTGKYAFISDFLIHDATELIKDAPTKKGKHPPRVAGLRRGGGSLGFSDTLKVLEADTAKTTSAIQNFYSTVSVDYRMALDQFTARTAQLQPTTIAKLKKKFGDDWVIAFRNGTQGITNKPVDKSIVADMQRVFHKGWRATLAGFANLQFLKEGGADAAALRKALAAAISHAVGGLTDADLKGHGKTATSATRTGITKYLSGTIGQAALDAAAGPDKVAAKKAFADLGTALKAAIPDASKRTQFIGMMVALRSAGNGKFADSTAFLGKMQDDKLPTALERSATAMDNLADAAVRFLLRTGNLGPTPTPSGSPPGKPGTNRRYEGASGLMFDTKGTTDLTVGEVGRERVVVLRAPRSMRLPDVAGMMSGMNLPGVRGAGAGSHHTQVLDIEHLHLNAPADERAVMDTLAFMAPAGV